MTKVFLVVSGTLRTGCIQSRLTRLGMESAINVDVLGESKFYTQPKKAIRTRKEIKWERASNVEVDMWRSV